jgi:hypothetical protein
MLNYYLIANTGCIQRYCSALLPSSLHVTGFVSNASGLFYYELGLALESHASHQPVPLSLHASSTSSLTSLGVRGLLLFVD